jgi:predicted helicase
MPKKPAKPKNPANKAIKKAIKQYYDALQAYRAQRVTHEGALQTAFQHLLSEAARVHHCTLIPQQPYKKLRPDGTVRDTLWDRAMGYWEAKDTNDNLDKEIAAKTLLGYPSNNIIYEDTRQAVLIQNKIEKCRFDLSQEDQLASLLEEFFAYHEPEIENFEDAVEQFKDRVPELAKGLVGKLDEAHKSNKKFQAAFESFFTICQQTLNPNISRAAVDEMLVQHLLTERLIRKIFDNPEFMHRNVIAMEIEKVIESLSHSYFNRDQFLKSLDGFYRAIEDAAQTLEDFAEKQHFLNTIYERFFQGYSVKVADTHGIVYTPQEIVDFMCASVEEVLKTEFNLTLGSKGVNILDPCTGTGNFIVNLIGRIPKKDLPRVYKEQLFANEVMLLPYYIAALNIEHAYWEKTGTYETFEGLCYVDTLSLAESQADQPLFEYMNEENTARVARQKTTPVTVIIGNPPYNMGQINENDNNQNRKYEFVDKRISETYAKDSSATLRRQLYDPYVKFFRWAVDRLDGRDGIICLVTNNSFVDQIAFDGMRKHLTNDFSQLFHLHLEGNVRHNPKLAGTIFNVFGIQVGVGITLAVKSSQHQQHRLFFHRIDKLLRKAEKLSWLANSRAASGIKWQSLVPDTGRSLPTI